MVVSNHTYNLVKKSLLLTSSEVVGIDSKKVIEDIIPSLDNALFFLPESHVSASFKLNDMTYSFVLTNNSYFCETRKFIEDKIAGNYHQTNFYVEYNIVDILEFLKEVLDQ